jgi:PASTA domain
MVLASMVAACTTHAAAPTTTSAPTPTVVAIKLATPGPNELQATVADQEALLEHQNLAYTLQQVNDANLPVNECLDGTAVVGLVPGPGSKVAPGTEVTIQYCDRQTQQ